MGLLRIVALGLAASFLSGAADAGIITFESFLPATYVTKTTLFEAGYSIPAYPVKADTP